MKDRDWVLLAYCRSCGVYGTAVIGDDHRISWPEVVHELDCDLAEAQDAREEHPWTIGAA
ncbi:hypothetical protein RCH16_000119 [Cryobacterium sp. MP_M5]|uniref:hypothetical protein n=1 Tax=unclassified Cryobacterium TaxID=2649013 RepID=UPI0018C93790|nr:MULTISPECIES: hypothetical protein [unclassified Cryobacterium]MBG6056933.1 hypothetical protein [Cryobacterium sp. MP_M3]MEC5175132.1 hypothetical protein [Cryobacterium sp. MP_M5]